MKLRTVLLLTLATGLLSPLMSHAQTKPSTHAAPTGKTPPTKTATVQMYECPICHHKVDAAEAKKYHYTCPVDNGRLAPVKTASARKSPRPPGH